MGRYENKSIIEGKSEDGTYDINKLVKRIEALELEVKKLKSKDVKEEPKTEIKSKDSKSNTKEVSDKK